MKLKETYIDSWFNKIKDQVELEESLIMEAKQVGEIYYCCPNFYALLSILGYPSYNEQIIRKSKALEIIKPVEGNTQTIDTYSFEKDTNNEIIGRKYNLVSMWRLAYNNKELFLNYLDTELAKLEDYEKQNNIEELRNDCATYTELFRKFETMPRGDERDEVFEKLFDLSGVPYSGYSAAQDPKSRFAPALLCNGIRFDIQACKQFIERSTQEPLTSPEITVDNYIKDGKMVPCTTYDFLVNFIEDVERDSARTSVSFSRSPGHTVRESWSVGVVVDGNKLSESNHIIPFGHLGRNLWKYKIKCIAQSPTDPTNCYLSFYTYDSLLIPETVYNDIVNIITSPDFQTNANAYIQNPFIYDPAGIEAKAERAKNLAGTNTKLPAFKKPPLDTRLGQRLALSSNAQIILDPNVRYSIELNNTIQKVSAEANVQGTSGVYTWPNQTGPSLEDLDNYAREHGQRQSKLHDFMASNSATTSVGREEEERIWTADDVNITGCVKGVLLPVEFKRYFDRQYSAAEIQELIANEQAQLEKDAKKKDKPASDEKRKSALWKDFFELQKAINTIRYDGKPLKILYTNSGRFTPDIVKDKLDPLGTKRDRLDKQRMYQGLFNPTDTTTNA